MPEWKAKNKQDIHTSLVSFRQATSHTPCWVFAISFHPLKGKL